MSADESTYDVAARLAHRRPLTTLADKVAPGHAALVVIDMQNDFCADGGLVAKGGRDVTAAQEMATRLPALIAAARAAAVPVVFVRNVYTTEGNAYLSDVWLEQAARKQGDEYTRVPVCREGSWEGDFYGEVRPEPGDPIVTKHRYSGFGGRPDVSELGHCVTQARRLPCSLTEGEPWHDQRSQGVSALVRGPVGGPPVRIRGRGPRAEPRRPP